MRIAHLNTSRTGGAALASMRYSLALESVGLKNDLYALGSQDPEISEQALSITRTPFETLKSKGLTVFQQKFLQLGSTLITPISSEPKSIEKIISKYDLIHLHSTYNILNSQGFTRLIDSGKKVVVTLHDQRWFTGGCHYSADCENYKSSCANCPRASTLGKLLISNSFAKYEKIWANDPRIKVITPSHWLSEQARSSKLLANAEISVIRNPIPDFEEGHPSTKSFNKNDVEDSLNKIVFIADNLQNHLKGLDVLLSALCELTDIEKKQFSLLVIGSNPPAVNRFPISTKHVKATSAQELSGYLEQQDLLVVPSRQDNLPNVIGEAFSCGIKVIGSNIGGIPEVIDAEVGEIFQSENYQELVNIIINFDYSYSREKVRSHFKSNFSYEIIGKQIANLYAE